MKKFGGYYHGGLELGLASGASGVRTPDITEEAGRKRLKRWRADRDEATGASHTWQAQLAPT